MADDIVDRLREEAMRPAIHYVCMAAAFEIDRLRAAEQGRIANLRMLNEANAELSQLREAGDALADLVRRRLPHHGWTTADREVASVVLDAWREARRG